MAKINHPSYPDGNFEEQTAAKDADRLTKKGEKAGNAGRDCEGGEPDESDPC